MNNKDLKLRDYQVTAMSEYIILNNIGKDLSVSDVNSMVLNYLDNLSNNPILRNTPPSLKSVSSFLLISELAIRKAYPKVTEKSPIGYYIPWFFLFLRYSDNIKKLTSFDGGGYAIQYENTMRLIKEVSKS